MKHIVAVILCVAAAALVVTGQPVAANVNKGGADLEGETMPVFISLVIASAVALPKPDARDGYSPAYDRCMTTGDAAQGITAGIMDCLGTEIDLQDAALNQTYKVTMARLGPTARTRLRADERRWIVQRDERCHAEADEGGGGSLSGIMYNNCVLDQTIARTRFLKAYAPKR